MQRRTNPQHLARIRVVGVGSGGRLAINSMILTGVYGAEFLTVDTDREALRDSKASLNIYIGDQSKSSMGAQGSADKGRKAAQGSLEQLRDALHGSDMVFIAAGLGGGTGTGAAPVIAQVAKQQEAVVIGIVTYPFSFEGKKRATIADEGIKALQNCVDTLIAIPNDRLLQMADGEIGFHETYRLAQDIWHQSIYGVSELVNQSGLINVDFADVRAIMTGGGAAVISTGRGKGSARATDAATEAARSELLGISIDGAHGLLFNVTGGSDMTLHEIEKAAELITSRAHPEANVIFGAAIDESLGGELCITVIATGFDFAEPKTSFSLRSRRPFWRIAPARR
jgi:cell division protein FtsZ